MLATPRSREARDEARECIFPGVAMVAPGLLYRGLLLAYAASLPVGWLAHVHVAGRDPLGAVKDPLPGLVWLLYWWIAIGLPRRGVGVLREQEGPHAAQ